MRVTTTQQGREFEFGLGENPLVSAQEIAAEWVTEYNLCVCKTCIDGLIGSTLDIPELSIWNAHMLKLWKPCDSYFNEAQIELEGCSGGSHCPPSGLLHVFCVFHSHEERMPLFLGMGKENWLWKKEAGCWFFKYKQIRDYCYNNGIVYYSSVYFSATEFILIVL